MKLSTELMRVLRFGVVGVAATATHVGSTLAFVEYGGVSPELGTTLGMTLAMWVSYFGHQMFTFGVAADHRTYLPRFIVTTIIAYLLNIGLVAGSTHLLGLPYQVGLAVVQVVIPITNYVIGRLWVFERGITAKDADL